MLKKTARLFALSVFVCLIGTLFGCDDSGQKSEGEEQLRKMVSYNMETKQLDSVDPRLSTIKGNSVSPYIPEEAEYGENMLVKSGQGIDSENMATNITSRSWITDNTSYPYRTFVQLIITYPNGIVARGSGTMVGYKHVFTAGHCVHDSLNGGYATSIIVIPGKSGSSEPYGRTWASVLTAPNGWTVSRNDNYDYGIITTGTRIGDLTGWHGYGYIDDDSLALNCPVTLYGYPSSSNYLYGDSDYIRLMDYWLFYTLAYGTGGQSGGPLRCNSSSSVLPGYVVGIYNGGSLVGSVSYNRCIRIRQYVFDTINAVKQANGD